MRGFLPFKGFLYIHEASSYLVSKGFFPVQGFPSHFSLYSFDGIP